MPAPVKLSKADARRALVRYHFDPSATPLEVFRRLRSVQFDPIAPIGCNHDLVLHAHTPNYKIGDWERLAYKEKQIFDGWDKQASLIPMESWPLMRFFHKVHRPHFEKKIFEDYKNAVEFVLQELTQRGPLMPKELSFQERRNEWKGSWHGPNVGKQILRALWHTGQVMIAARKRGQHVYDIAERIVPPELFSAPEIPEVDSRRELVLERHRAMGMVRPAAPAEIWSYTALYYTKKESLAALLDRNEIVPVEVEGMKANAAPEFLEALDQSELDPRVVFIAPLDPFMWDRKMVGQIFGFDYTWEIYTPEAKRRWGYYVLPVLYGNDLVARVEFYAREGVIEVREWHWETKPGRPFWTALSKASKELMRYASADRFVVRGHVDAQVRDFFAAL